MKRKRDNDDELDAMVDKFNSETEDKKDEPNNET